MHLPFVFPFQCLPCCVLNEEFCNFVCPANPHTTRGALLVGDAFNMRHPFTGVGMTVALSDIVLLRDLLRPIHDLNDTSTLSKYLDSFYTLRTVSCRLLNYLKVIIREWNIKWENFKNNMNLDFVAWGIYDQHVSWSASQGLQCIAWSESDDKGNGAGLFWLFEP